MKNFCEIVALGFKNRRLHLEEKTHTLLLEGSEWKLDNILTFLQLQFSKQKESMQSFCELTSFHLIYCDFTIKSSPVIFFVFKCVYASGRKEIRPRNSLRAGMKLSRLPEHPVICTRLSQIFSAQKKGDWTYTAARQIINVNCEKNLAPQKKQTGVFFLPCKNRRSAAKKLFMLKDEHSFINPYNQGMTPITKIEIPIFIRNWDRDPDLNLKKHLRSDPDYSSTLARSFGRSFFYTLMEKLVEMWKK